MNVNRMNANDFVAAWCQERDKLLSIFTDATSQSETARLFSELQLNPEQQAKLVLALKSALTDSFYTLLIGLDGGANIGAIQEQFSLFTSDGNLIAKPGELEVAAYESFYAA